MNLHILIFFTSVQSILILLEQRVPESNFAFMLCEKNALFYDSLSGNVSTSCIREMLNRDTGYFMCISLIIWQPLIYSIFLPILSLNGPNPFYLLILKILHSSTYFNFFFNLKALCYFIISYKTLTKTECSIPVGSVLFIYLPHYAVCNVFSTLFLMPHDTSFALFFRFAQTTYTTEACLQRCCQE